MTYFMNNLINLLIMYAFYYRNCSLCSNLNINICLKLTFSSVLFIIKKVLPTFYIRREYN